MLVNGTTYHDDTDPKIVEVLERCRTRCYRIRVFYGDTSTGKSWEEEYDTIGYVERSGGNVKIPLLVNNARSMGGSGILDNRIVKITMADGRQVLYEHPDFHTAGYAISNSTYPDLPVGVFADGVNVANFPTLKKAQRWIDFITGKRNTK